MSAAAIISVICIFLIIGIIFLTEAFLRIILARKTNPHTVIIYFSGECANIEYILRQAARKHPASKIIVKYESSDSDTEKRLDILKRIYPNITVIKL